MSYLLTHPSLWQNLKSITLFSDYFGFNYSFIAILKNSWHLFLQIIKEMLFEEWLYNFGVFIEDVLETSFIAWCFKVAKSYLISNRALYYHLVRALYYHLVAIIAPCSIELFLVFSFLDEQAITSYLGIKKKIFVCVWVCDLGSNHILVLILKNYSSVSWAQNL